MRERTHEMFDNVVVGAGGEGAGPDALELATQLVSTDGNLIVVAVEVEVLPPDTDPPMAGFSERRRELQQLASLRDEAYVDAQLLCVQARSVARGLHQAARQHGDPCPLLVLSSAGA